MATLDVANSPNDWPETYPQLRNLDTMLRCGICFEFMDTALILPQCSHNYCSLCIRRYIGYKPQCPACAKNIAQTDLKNNRIVDDIIKTFTELRSSLLKLVVSSRSQLTTDGHQTQATTKREEVVAFKTTTKQLRSPRLMQTNTAINASSRRCTKNAHSHSNDSIILDDSESSSDLPQQQRRSLEAHVLGEEVDIETDEDMFWSDDEGDRQLVRSKDSGCTPGKMGSDPANFPPNTNTISLSSDKMTSPTAVSSMSSPSSSSMFAMHRSPVTRVDCPVCGVSIPDRHINMHLDQCLRAGPRLTTTTATASKAPLRKPLPKLVYNLMKDQQLKKRLADFRLPTQGDRQTLIRRHQDYTVMYNSQCDTLDPMTPGDIAKAVVENEKCKIKFRSTAPSSTQKFAAKKGDTVETVFQAQQKYVKQHKSQFSALLAQTRHRLQEQREKPEIQASAAHNTSSDTKCQLTENARKSDDRDATNYIIAKDAASSSEVALFAGDDIMSDSEDDSDHDIYHGSPQWSLCDGVTEILDGDIIDGEVKIQPNGCDDTDDGTDSDVTVDNSVPLVTEEQEEEGETKGDEINQDHADEAEEISPTENHRQEEPLDASDTDFEPMRKRQKRKTKASVSESPKGNSVVKKTKKNAEKTVAQDSNEPDATVKKPTGRQLRARRRNKDNGIGSNIDRSNVLKHT